MTRQTTMLLFGLLALGAILWIALGGTPSDPAGDQPPAQGETGYTPDEAMEARPSLGSERPRLGPLVVHLRSEVEDVIERGMFLVRLRSEKTGGSLVVMPGKEGPSILSATLGWKHDASTARTAEGIAITFPRIPRGAWDLDVTLRGPLDGRAAAKPATIGVGADGAEVVIELTDKPEPGALRVQVVQDGRIIPNATIRARSGGLSVLDLRTPAPGSDAAKRFHGVPSERDLLVEVTHYRGMGLFGRLEPKQVNLAPGEQRELVFEVPKGQALRIQAVSGHGERVGASLVLWRRSGQALEPIDVMDGMGPKDEGWEGVLPPGSYRAMVLPHAHYARAQGDFELTFQDEQALVEIRAGDRGVRATLSLTRADGSPAAETRFNLNRITDDEAEADFFSGRTDVKGGKVSRPLLPGRYRLYLWNEKLAREIEVTGPESRHAFQLPAMPKRDEGVSISGLVTYRDGAPANGLYVHARPDKGGWERLGRCDADGRFAIQRLEPGAYDVFTPERILDTKRFARTSRRVVLGTTATTLKIQLKAE